MHISDGVLSMPVVAATSIVAVGLVAYGLKGLKEKEIPRIALMAATFFTASLIHFNVGASSVHLLLSGITGLMLGRRTPVAIAVALILQLLMFQFGGISSLGANIISASLPAMFVAALVRPYIGKKAKNDFICGALAGGFGVLGTILIVVFLLIESNLRFGMGAFSTSNIILVSHVPVMIIEAVVTAFAIRMIARIRPEMLDFLPHNYEVSSS